MCIRDRPIAILYAITDEVHQRFVPGRSCQAADWAIDTAGAALGPVSYTHLDVYKRQLLQGVSSAVCLQCPNLHLTETLAAELGFTA